LCDAQVVILSYQFARSKEAELTAVAWDLVVIDEAHRLRNVYKAGNKIANSVKTAIHQRPVLLLTATPAHVAPPSDGICALH
jgi:adenine-specific DNA-methyltransferase